MFDPRLICTNGLIIYVAWGLIVGVTMGLTMGVSKYGDENGERKIKFN